MTKELEIRPLAPGDPEIISTAFSEMGWNKPVSQYEKYLRNQAEGERAIWIALVDGTFAGYGTVCWIPEYPYFRENRIPEIQDLNVLRHVRRRGIATALMDTAEREIRKRSQIAGIGVGLHPGYNAAQRMYVLRGYVPDGNGVAYNNRYVKEGETLPFDDSLVLYFTKRL